MLDNEIKKVLYEKALKKELALVFMGIDNNVSFEAYRIQLIVINDHLTQYKSNFNEIVYSIILKTEYFGPVLESTGDNIMEWEIIIIISKPKNQKIYENWKKKKQKKTK